MQITVALLIFAYGYGSAPVILTLGETETAPDVCAFPNATGYGKVFVHLFDFRYYIIRLLFPDLFI